MSFNDPLIVRNTNCNEQCGHLLAKGNICNYTDNRIKHVTCKGKPNISTLGNTYVVMNNPPQEGMIHLRRATLQDLKKHNKISPGYAQINTSEIEDSKTKKLDDHRQQRILLQVNQYLEPLDQFLKQEEAKEANIEASIQQAQVTGLSESQGSSIQEIMQKVSTLESKLEDVNSDSAHKTEAQTAVEKVITEYLEETAARPTKWEIISSRLIELPAKGKILELAEERAEEPHTQLLYLIHLAAHQDTPKTAIQAIKTYFDGFNARWDQALENYSAQYEEDYTAALLELKEHLDAIITIRLKTD